MENMTNKQYKAGFPGILYAGCGSIDSVNEILEETHADKIVVFIDRAVKELQVIQKLFSDLDCKLVGMIDDIPSEPTIGSVQGVFDTVKTLDVNLIIAIGGGSIIDMAKIIAVALTNSKFVESGFTKTELIRNNAIPTVMMPTTAGTGAEATPNAIFVFPEKELKIGIVSNKMVAYYVILEPRLTVGLPKNLTAYTGIDALCHAIESYLSTMANPVSRTFSLKAATLIIENIEVAYLDGSDIKARENMLLGSFFAGMCLFSSTTVAVHALSYPLGGKYRIPHGVSNAILLPLVLEANLSVCKEEYRHLAEVMLPEDMLRESKDIPSLFVEYITELCKRLQIPQKLTSYGVKMEDAEYLAENALEVKRLLYKNPKELTKEEIKDIYIKLL